MVRDTRHDESVQLQHVREDLVREFSTLPVALVSSQVLQVQESFAGARVRTFIPVLVGRRARARLRHFV